MESPPITSKVVAYMVFGFIFTVFVILLIFIISSQITDIAEIPAGLEEHLFTQRFLNNQDCFAYEDKEIGRIFPGIIDLDKFNQDNLDKCYTTDNKFSFRLTIDNLTIQTNNFDVSDKTDVKDILIYKGDGFEDAKLKIES